MKCQGSLIKAVPGKGFNGNKIYDISWSYKIEPEDKSAKKLIDTKSDLDEFESTMDKIIEKNTTTTGPQSVVLSLTFNHLSTFQYSIQRLLTPVLRSL